MILANPAVSQNELAEAFGYSASWMSIVVNSNAFQEKLAERKGELIDPVIKASIEQRMDQLAKMSMDLLMEKLEAKDGSATKIALESMKTLAPLVGPQRQMQTTNNLYVVQSPPRARSNEEWSGAVIDMQLGAA
jgi:hypothetical protein